MTDNERFPLGTRVHDCHTGINGIAVAFTHWHYRTSEVAVIRDGVDSDGRPWELLWFDMSRLSPCTREKS